MFLCLQSAKMMFQFVSITNYCTACVICALIGLIGCKKTGLLKTSEELLKKESERIENDGLKCGISVQGTTFLQYIEHYRLTSKCEKAIPCIIERLLESSQDGWLWSTLGECYKQQAHAPSFINNSFKQANKITGKHSPYFSTWHFIGPFSVGKSEFDGDPIGAYGGIGYVAGHRLTKGWKFYSELMPGGEIKWKKYKQSGANEEIKINPEINWNDLVGSLQSVGVTEWQGWAVAEFAVNEDNANLLFQCMNVHTIFINKQPVAGEVYGRPQFEFAVDLPKGIHTIYVKLRTKAIQIFQCHIKVAPTSTWNILQATMLPDFYDGYLFGEYISLPVINLDARKWLSIKKLKLVSQSIGKSLETVLHHDSKNLEIAPGQVIPIIFRIVSTDSSSKILPECNDIKLQFSLSTSEGQKTVTMTLRCRKRSQSFIFTFLDHDGSIQHAAAIYPRSTCITCPILLTLHGTTVPPQNQADSYKHMVNGEYVFGVDGIWVLAPTRHGAHNWEGPGALTALSAAAALKEITIKAEFIQDKATDEAIIFAGHSMGGHGAWHLATHFPDKALAVVSLAGWIKKEEYGDSNMFFRHDVSTSSVDPMTKAVMEMCIAENDADRLVSNLKDIPVLTRIGALDRTVHPYFTRRMYRVLKENNVNVTYTELPGKEHWWWDTWETNDGGAVNDPSLRSFTAEHSNIPESIAKCRQETEKCTEQEVMSKYSSSSNEVREFTLTVINPAFGGSLHGAKILRQKTTHRISKIMGRIDGTVAELKTVNVKSFSLEYSGLRPISWNDQELNVDGHRIPGRYGTFCKIANGEWSSCGPTNERSFFEQGPARRIAEQPFVIVVGTKSNADVNKVLLDSALFIANLFYLTSDAYAPIIRDIDCSSDLTEAKNLIVLGGIEENSLTASLMKKVPLNMNKGIEIGSCNFNEDRSGALFLAPSQPDKLALVLMGNSLDGLMDIVSLASPTIPPMTRSPFSNMIPDFIITGPEFILKGPGGYSCAGFWGNNWEYRPELVSCAC